MNTETYPNDRCACMIADSIWMMTSLPTWVIFIATESLHVTPNQPQSCRFITLHEDTTIYARLYSILKPLYKLVPSGTFRNEQSGRHLQTCCGNDSRTSANNRMLHDDLTIFLPNLSSQQNYKRLIRGH